MRKSRFIDDIRIDDDFNTRIYRNDEIHIDRLVDALKTNTEAQLIATFGKAAIMDLQEITGTSDIGKQINYFLSYKEDYVVLPVEIDKTSLSNGEKQIFIMALYTSPLVKSL